MSNDVTPLAALRAEADTECPPVTIALDDGTEVALRPLSRLPQTVRDTVNVQLRDLDSLDPSDIDRRGHVAAAVLKMVADKGEELVAELDGDAVLAGKVLERWRAQPTA